MQNGTASNYHVILGWRSIKFCLKMAKSRALMLAKDKDSADLAPKGGTAHMISSARFLEI